MIEVVPFKAEHLEYVLATGMQDEKLRPFFTPAHGVTLASRNEFYTVLDDGRPVVFGGIINYWRGRGEAWLVFGKPRTENFWVIFRIVKRFLLASTLRRIEMVVDYDFTAGHRWAQLLGFKKEAEILKHYRPDGGDVSLYAMVRT